MVISVTIIHNPMQETKASESEKTRHDEDLTGFNRRLEESEEENNEFEAQSENHEHTEKIDVKVDKKSEKQEWLKKEFDLDETDELLDSCSGALLRTVLVQGKIHVTKNYLLFYSSIFGYVTKKKWSFSAIQTVRKRRGKLVANSIKVIFSESTTIPVVLASLSNRSRILNSISLRLQKRQSSNNMNRSVTFNAFEERKRTSIAASGTDLNAHLLSKLPENEENNEVRVEENMNASFTKAKRVSDGSDSQLQNAQSKLMNTPVNENDAMINSAASENNIATIIPRSSEDNSEKIEEPKFVPDIEYKEENKLEREPLSNVTSSGSEIKSVAFEFSEVKVDQAQEPKTSDVTASDSEESKEESGKGETVPKHVRSKSTIEMQDALESMVWRQHNDPVDVIFGKKYKERTTQAKDVLKYPPQFVFNFLFTSQWIERYLSDTNNLDITVSDWYKSETTGILERKISYVRPLTHRMGPRQTRVRETQRYCFKSDGGVLIESEARNLDVPYGDNFRVESFFELAPTEGGKKTEIVVSIALNFIKGTMLRGVIESATMSETKILFEKMIEMGRDELDSAVPKSHVAAFLRKKRKPSIFEQFVDMTKKVLDF